MPEMAERKYKAEQLLVRAPLVPDVDHSGRITSISADKAGWKLLDFEVRRLAKDAAWSGHTEQGELGLVILGGRCRIESNRGEWAEVGGRPHVFAGLAHALYLPPQSDFRLTALTPQFEVAACRIPADQEHPASLVTPAEIAIELRGGHNATRQINSIFPPGFDCQRLVCVEVYTPGGNWSSYPPHKHDQHRVDDQGQLVEADLEEVYFYKFDRPGGFAMQRVYTSDGALDAALVTRHNDTVLVPYGYHPVSAAYGYPCYYLNFLAGSAQSLACYDDPQHAWIKETWTSKDPRVPLVDRGMHAGDTFCR